MESQFLLTYRQTADALRINPNVVDHLVNVGRLCALQVGTIQYVPVSEIQRFIQAQIDDDSPIGDAKSSVVPLRTIRRNMPNP